MSWPAISRPLWKRSNPIPPMPISTRYPCRGHLLRSRPIREARSAAKFAARRKKNNTSGSTEDLAVQKTAQQPSRRLRQRQRSTSCLSRYDRDLAASPVSPVDGGLYTLSVARLE